MAQRLRLDWTDEALGDLDVLFDHMPPGSPLINVMAHNLTRWVSRVALEERS